ncbi:hypothetical protein [Actinocrispum sp. NPDC049592]|uniref:hypothetical protein n=1 Tax=Actinocrispum sp. NPDC049592 TaxID=3154835 RepID=UPI0034150D90
MFTTLAVALPVLLAPAVAPPKALAVCDDVTNIMLCKPMDTLSLPPDPTLGDARTEAMRRYGQLPWVCQVNAGGRMDVPTCVLPTGPDSTPLRDLLNR